MKYWFMYEHRRQYRNSKMAEVMEASRSGYYVWVKQGCISWRRQRDEEDLVLIRRAFEDTRGDLWGKASIEASPAAKFKTTTDSNHDYPVAPNLLNRNFTVAEPNTAWFSDITYVAIDKGWLYLRR